MKIHKIPEGEAVSKDYKVKINNIEVDVYSARVSSVPFNTAWPGHQRPLDQTELASFMYFGMNEPVRIEVEAQKDFKDVIVRPISKEVKVETEGKKIYFTIDKIGQYTLELDGFHYALHIFADPIDPVRQFETETVDNNTLYFGPGVHYPGIIELEDNQTLYIDWGAVVHCSIIAKDKKNIRITGHGILDNSTFHRKDSNVFDCPTSAIFYNCQNVEISGVIFKDSCSWTATFFNCDNMLIENVKTIGMWRYNSDGIDFVNSANGIIKNCFLRNFDDVIALKGLKGYDNRNVENILVENCVLWCDWGRALEIGAETCADEYRNIIFRTCDILHTTHIAMDIQNGDRANVQDVLFEDINVEYSRFSIPHQYQYTDEEKYQMVNEPHMPVLFKAELYCGRWSDDNLYGTNRNIRLRNINVYLDEGLPMPEIQINGANSQHITRDVILEDYFVNGIKINTIQEANVIMNEFTENIKLK